MLVFVFFLIYSIISISKKRSLSAFMGLLVVFEIFIAFIMGTIPPFDFVSLIGQLWIILILYILMKPYERYKIVELQDPKGSIDRFANIIIIMNLISLAIGGFVAYLTFKTFDNYSLYKGQHDLSQDFFQTLPFSTKFLTLSYILGSTYPICLSLHFYYLNKSKWMKAIICLIGSLSYPVRMLAYFSRASFLILGCIYVAYTILVFPILSQKAKRVFTLLGGLFASAILLIFMIISINRFGEVGTSIKNEDSALYSFADYASQWFGNSIEVLHSYKGPVGGELSDVFWDYWGFSGGKDNTTVRSQLWPNHYWRFIGLPIVWLFDFGVLLTVIISVFYAVICHKLKPINHKMDFYSFISFGALIILPIASFSGSILEELVYHYTIIALLLIYCYFRIIKGGKVISR